jgi:hypothetical protein
MAKTIAPKQTKVYPGARIGYWKVIGRVSTPKGETQRWRIECECGTRETIRQNYLTRDNPKESCGCKRRTNRTEYKREYGIWTMMQVRCYNKNHVSYLDYGGRGIRVEEVWLDKIEVKDGIETRVYDGFERFLKDMGPAPTDKHTLDRIDPDSNYGPGESGKPLCRWATMKEQANNKRSDKIRRAKAVAAARLRELNKGDSP